MLLGLVWENLSRSGHTLHLLEEKSLNRSTVTWILSSAVPWAVSWQAGSLVLRPSLSVCGCTVIALLWDEV